MNKKTLNIILLILGGALILLGITNFINTINKPTSGVFLGIGSGLIGMSGANLLMINWYKKHPDEMELSEIEASDERNELIRNKAKAKTSDIIQWLIMGLAWVTIFFDFPLWMTLALVIIFALKSIIELSLMGKYNKTM